MFHKFRLLVFIGLVITPLCSQALGLGKITSGSALNQPFEAEIELLSVAPGELDGVKVALASEEAFSKAEVDRPYLLSRLKFEIIQKENGQAAIRVFSRQAVSEPFLTFLVEVDWPKGHLVREFSVLLEIQ